MSEVDYNKSLCATCAGNCGCDEDLWTLRKMIASLEAKIESQRITYAERMYQLDCEKRDAEASLTRMQDATSGLVEECRKHLAQHFPPNSRDLDWDVFPGAVANVCNRLAAAEAKVRELVANSV